MKNIISPFVENGNTRLIGKVPTSYITNRYSTRFNADVSKFFKNIEYVEIYECISSGYQFYYPYELSGDSAFYETLEKQDFYYMSWKWEHEAALQFINEEDNLLEIGCGKGAFISNLLKRKKITVVGLELNESSVEYAKTNKLPIISEMIEEHAIKNKEKYDIVCYFQVLEHISKVNSFIHSSIQALKEGGKLIISVPNNDSFIGLDNQRNILNMPPHHMGLWGEKAMISIEKHFPVKLEKILYEPIQPQHYNWYMTLMHRKKYGVFIAKILLLLSKLGLQGLFHKRIIKHAASIKGHSIMAVYSKN